MFQNVEAAKLTLCVRNMMPERLTRTPDMFAKQIRKLVKVNLKNVLFLNVSFSWFKIWLPIKFQLFWKLEYRNELVQWHTYMPGPTFSLLCN